MDQSNILPNILILLSAAVVIVALFKKLNLSPVLGYFVAGAVIGELGKSGFSIVSASDTKFFGEFGVIFLLFAIGLELTFERLKAMRVHVFGFGSAQVIITSIVLGVSVYLYSSSVSVATIIGGGFALSSTAIVLQVIAENRQQSTQVGRLSLAVLLMQDFAVVPLLVFIPLFNGSEVSIAHAMGMASLKAIGVLLVIFILGRTLFRPFFGMISSTTSTKNNELFVATTLLIALGAAWGTEHMGLSSALGAFVAGLLVAETEFHIQAEESISPFKGLFLGLFFMTVGMSIDLNFVIAHIGKILLLSVGLILVKATIITSLCLIFQFKKGAAIHAGLLLAQGGEFAFILFDLASKNNIISKERLALLLPVVTITMALTPLLSSLGKWCSKKFDRSDVIDNLNINKEIADLNNHVIIIGFGRVGKMVARLLEAEKIHYVATEIDIDNVEEERKEGFPVYPGDGSNLALLKSLGINRASSIIITVDNEVTLKKVSKVISTNYPGLPVVVRAKDLSDSSTLYHAGATIIVPETYETGLQLGGAVLKSIGISEFEVSRIKNQFRLGNYILAKETEEEIIEDEDGGYDYLGQHMIDESVIKSKHNN